ncbi:MAG: BspA family leucine-rich repeat surface protein [Atopobiaceae bacterium]|nr:BspA family leucine-rich repeat surface protein [Atopobiaceae bacterium]
MRRTLRGMAAALLVALMLAQQLPAFPVAYATEGAGSAQQESKGEAGADGETGEAQQEEGLPNTNEAVVAPSEEGDALASEGDGEAADPQKDQGTNDGQDLTGKEDVTEATDAPALRSATPPARGSVPVAYAVLTDDGRLVFLQSTEEHQAGPSQTVTDVAGATWSGEVYTGIEGASYALPSDVPWHARSAEVSSFSVADGSTVRPTSCAWLLSGLANMTSCDLSGLDTSGATSMRAMLYGCSSLASLDASPLDTSSVTDMAGMFAQCRSLASLDLTCFDVSRVETMGDLTRAETGRTGQGMFSCCHALTTLDIAGWDTSSVTDMSAMFCQCMSLDPIPVAELDTHNVRNMMSMFAVNYYRTSLDLSCLDTSSLTEAFGMLNGMTALETLDVSSFDTSRVADMYAFFGATPRLREVRLGTGFTFKGAAQDESGWSRLADAPTTAPNDGTWCRDWDRSTAITATQLRDTYDGATMAGWWRWTVQDGDAYAVYDGSDRTLTLVRSFDALPDGPNQTVTDICGNTWTGTVYGGVETLAATCAEDVPWHDALTDAYRSPRTFQVAEGCTVRPTSCAWWLSGDGGLKNVRLDGLDTSHATSFAHMFDGCQNLEELDATPLDTSSATSTAYMFNYCRYLRALDLSGLDTSNVTDMSHMFCQCEHVASLDLSEWNTSNVTDMSYLFSLCKAMASLDITGWDTSRVTDMGHMFGGCNALAHVPTEALSTSSCTDMSGMFGGCWVAESLDLSGFDTSNVTDMSNMFASCQALTNLDLKSFDTTSATDLTYMFQTCTSLQSVDLSSFDMRGATTADTMFSGCSALREVTLGENFCFLPEDTRHNYLPSPRADDTYTGNWANRDDETQSFDAVWLAMRYDGSTMAGTWVWEEWHPFALTLDLGGGSAPEGQEYPTEYQMGQSLALPGTSGSDLDEPTWYGHTFTCWRDEDGNWVTEIDNESRGARTITAEWYTPQIRVQVPVAATLDATQEADGTLSLASEDGDFALSLWNTSSLPVVATAKATAADGFAIRDADDGLADLEADVWLTPTTTGSDPTADGYDPSSDAQYAEHGEVRLSRLGDGAQVGPTIPAWGRVWLNKLGGRMGGWSTNAGAKEQLLTISWTFSLAPQE